MNWMKKKTKYFLGAFIFGTVTFTALSSFAQTLIKGRVVYQKDQEPAAYATIGLNSKKDSVMADKNGNFRLSIHNLKNSDTIIISSVGFETLRMPVSKALLTSEYKLKEIVRNLESVTVFSRYHTVGDISDRTGYYRSWNTENTGGEIGKIFKLPFDAFKIEKVRFKAGNTCDTCILKLHIREVVNEIPGDDLLEKEVTTMVSRLSLDDKISEFDLTPYKITFYEEEIFVSIEVLRCSNRNKEFCSFSFAGTDKGENIFKPGRNSKWQSSNDDSIFLRLSLRY